MNTFGDTSELTLFISDLHLCASRPHITTSFLRFLENIAIQAKALYILGDLFEYWAGDDVNDPFHQSIIVAFRQLASTGTNIYLMHGNRDFLISDIFCNIAHITLLQDPTLIEVHGQRLLLSHGDDLCTDDETYQQFRQQVRKPAWQKDFLNQPLPVRKNQIEAIRTRSEQDKSQKSATMMDVNQHAVMHLLRQYDYPNYLIHGHTHRPNQHLIELDGHNITRWVLADWYEHGSYVAYDAIGFTSISLA